MPSIFSLNGHLPLAPLLSSPLLFATSSTLYEGSLLSQRPLLARESSPGQQLLASKGVKMEIVGGVSQWTYTASDTLHFDSITLVFRVCSLAKCSV